MQKRAKRSAHQTEHAVHEAHDEPYDRTISWIDDQKHAPGEFAGDRGQAYTVWRAAHNAIEDDDIGPGHGLRMVEDIRNSKCASTFKAFVTCELPRVRFVG